MNTNFFHTTTCSSIPSLLRIETQSRIGEDGTVTLNIRGGVGRIRLYTVEDLQKLRLDKVHKDQIDRVFVRHCWGNRADEVRHVEKRERCVWCIVAYAWARLRTKDIEMNVKLCTKSRKESLTSWVTYPIVWLAAARLACPSLAFISLSHAVYLLST